MRAEAWTMPTAATFEKKLDLELIGGSGSRALSTWADESIVVSSLISDANPDNSNGDSDLEVIMTEAPWIRIINDAGAIVDEFKVLRAETPLDRPSTIVLTGPQRNGLVEGIAIYPWDWPRQPSTVWDHIWGGEDLLGELALGELGSVREEWTLYNDQTGGGTFTLTVDGQTTESFAYNASTNTIEGTATGGTGLQGLSTVNDVTVSGSGTSDDPWIIVFFDPPDPTTVTKTDANGLTSTLTKTVEGALDPSPITESRPVDAGAQDTEVHGTYDDPPVEVDTSVVNTGSEYSIKVNATGRFAGTQIVVSVTPGEMLQPSIPLRPTITSDFVLVIHDEFENQIARTADTQLTAGSFTTLALSDVVIPAGVTRIIMRAAVVDTTPANIGDFYADWQGAELRRGMAEATPGEIVRVLVEAAQARNTAEFLDISSFSDTQDSAGNNWPSTLSFSAFADHDLGHVLEDLHALTQDEAVGEGYEWRIVHKASPSGGFTHDLELYLAGGAGNAIGDWTDPPSVTAGAAPEFSMVRRVPEFTVGLAHGEGGVFSEKSDSTLVTSFGRWERPFDAEQLGTDATLTEFLEGAFARQASNEKAARAVVTWLDSSVPLTDYEEGDEIYWMFPPLLDREARVVRRVDWEVGEPDRFVVYGSRVLTGEAAMAAALHKYLRDAKRRRRMPGAALGGGAGGGGAPTVVVAASDATDLSKSKADFICAGDATDGDTIRAAWDALQLVSSNRKARILLTEGTFNIDVAGGGLDLVTISGIVTLQGMGHNATNIAAFNTHSTGSPVSMVHVGPAATIRDVTFIGPSSGDECYSLHLDGSLYARVVHCHFQGGGAGSASYDLYAEDTQNLLVSACSFEESSNDVGIYMDANFWSVVSNNFGNPTVAIHSQNSAEISIVDNMLLNGTIVLVGTDDSLVANNAMFFVDGHGIDVGGDQNLVEGNRIYRPSGDGIRVAGDGNYLVGNFISATSATRGINIISGTANAYLGNRARGTYSTAAYVDSGTSTVNTWPGAAAPQGDNLT